MRLVVIGFIVAALVGCADRPQSSSPTPGAALDGSAPPASERVRKELEAVFAERVRATKDKDAAALVALISPDYSAVTPSGQRFDADQIKAYLRRGTEQFVKVIDLSITIEKLTVNGDEAVVDARQRFTRTQRLQDGQVHEVFNTVLQTETWVRTAAGWRLKSVADIREQTITVDGKPVDPSKP